MFLTISTELLRVGYSMRFRAGGHSMHPTIRDGEAVTVEPVRLSAIKRGDILLYQTAWGVVAHRVVTIRAEEDGQRVFTLRGDAVSFCDKPIEAGQVLGRMVSVERGKRTLSLISKGARLRRRARLWAAYIKGSFRRRGK